MRRMNTADQNSQNSQLAGHLLVDCLVAQGVTHAWGVPGESYLAVLDGMHARRDKIAFVTCRQEGGAAFMAEAHGKLTGRPGVCMVTRGPGATNASIGVHTAFQDSTPMVLLVGDVASDQRDREAFQEVNYQHLFAPLAKRVERIDEAARIPEYIQRAFATAMNGRPGPVVLILPEDMLSKRVSASVLPTARVEAAQAWIDPGSLRDLRAMLLDAKSPLVIAGGGGWTVEAARALQRFAENWRLPVANAFRFQDTFDNHHPLYAGDVGIGINPALAKRVKDADLIIAIGPRLGEMTTSGYSLLSSPRPAQKLVHIHASAEELHRVYGADIAICASMNAAARALEVLDAPVSVAWEAHSSLGYGPKSLENQVFEAWQQPEALAGLDAANPRGAVDMAHVVGLIQKHLPVDAVITNGAGNFASWVHRYFRYAGLAKGLKTQLAPTNGAMGYGVPAGIAASIATGRVAFTIAGDGDFLMNGQELATATMHGAKPIIVLLNNASFGTIRMHQEREFPTRTQGAGNALVNPDFCALAQAYGFAAHRVERTDQFEAAFITALQAATSATGQGSLIEIVMDVNVISTRASLEHLTRQALAR
jgi:acetolactate synthase I/II/III large subunit